MTDADDAIDPTVADLASEAAQDATDRTREEARELFDKIKTARENAAAKLEQAPKKAD